jgi:hypothetical protein
MNENRALYRLEYYEPFDENTYVQWVWLKDDEVEDYLLSCSDTINFRKATEAESELYNEAYADGYSVAALIEFESQYDGITFRVDFDEAGSLTNMQGKKMFQCAVCDRHQDFDENVATAGGMYLGAIRDEKLWHICYDCAQGSAEVEWIEQGWVWDDDSGTANKKNS